VTPFGPDEKPGREISKFVRDFRVVIIYQEKKIQEEMYCTQDITVVVPIRVLRYEFHLFKRQRSCVTNYYY